MDLLTSGLGCGDTQREYRPTACVGPERYSYTYFLPVRMAGKEGYSDSMELSEEETRSGKESEWKEAGKKSASRKRKKNN